MSDKKKLQDACRLLLSGVYLTGYLTSAGTLNTNRAVKMMMETGMEDPRLDKTETERVLREDIPG